MSMISQFVKNLRLDYFNAIDQILKELTNSQNRAIIFEKELKFCLFKYFNFEWAKDHTDRKSISGFILTLNERLIYYNTKKKAVIVLFWVSLNI